ncbi:NADP-dependent oxidoreductase domain-containing protein [Truncatella angustata]|uniref:NADP-dependent oxidoreductase domain-containing protein n=1 Tax=Truncatella angustata TaxID=152316 RepID=A0A9P8RPB5_9PEZI|nr:NADP-dependent oxidoreductase domain-containing protein [Truncatella angustata]KAH6647175.1 NADP-dependent oxidoreductase domain-containing protein [Truncatella angustata]
MDLPKLPDYKNEAELGLAIKESGVPRSELFVTTKAIDHQNIQGSLQDSLQKLGLEYIDLYLIHEPFSARGSAEALQAAWRGMEACVDKGLARDIGVSNFQVPHLETVLETSRIRPAVNQVELHPYLPRAGLVDFCRRNGITVEAFGPLTPLTRVSPGPVDDVVGRLAEKHRVGTSAVLLRWLVERGVVVVTTSGKRERLQEYLTQVPTLRLSQKEVEEISTAGEGKRFRQFLADAYGQDNWE